ncbi:putative siderophore transport system permease protein YfiZ precursor [Devosia equisanguinis]|uniref:Putative siderophore transport system permease protein YfiZ n=1 Tax=Devosia equisanguinis TaxID=2490941 RepID=A0A447IF84_9HYPH|nr:iron chelate uptake ABC transporter family permease subunit [Devosia equisanguinis]VDS06128.1 putative siderophore transport system permease protein YfiZ precursor [Devosia equisanguinis]
MVEAQHQHRRLAPLMLGLGVLAAALFALVVLSLTVGARPIAFETMWNAVVAFDPNSTEHRIIWDLRLPRTLAGLLVGAALGLAGAVLQGATRNPLADPAILGIHSGASLFVVVGVALFGLSQLSAYVWFAFAGAAAAMLVVYSVASLGREGATPIKLALAGAATTAVMQSFISAILLTSTRTLDEVRFWQVGSLAGRSMDIVLQVSPFLVAGAILALASARMLDGLAMGEDVARALGQKVGLSRAVAALAAVVLAGASTAAAGPIAFVGLTVPHVARAITGPTYRWILPYSMLLAPILLLGADILGRVIAPPGEVQVGIVTAFIGAPFFIALVRRRKLASL